MYKQQHKHTHFRHLGRIAYADALAYQSRLFESVVARKVANRALPPEAQEPTENYLLFCEHPHVYTLGKSGDIKNILIDKHTRQEKGISFFHTNRGGDITYHGPGQIVGYPILDLDNFFTDIYRYLRLLEEAVIRTLAEYGIRAGRIEKLTGVWITEKNQIPRKICALGVKAGRWVSMHGFALNVNTDLSFFEHIIPCGISDKQVTSMQKELGLPQAIEQVEQKLLKHLAQLFDMQITNENRHINPQSTTS